MDQNLESYCFGCEKPAFIKVEWDDIDDFIANIPKKARVSVIVDSISEDTVVEEMPVLLPWEKHALQQRMQNKFLSKGAICHHITWTGIRNSRVDTRKEELVISSVLYPSKQIEALIAAIVQAKLIWLGFYSASILFHELLKNEIRKKAKIKNTILKKSPILMLIRVSDSYHRQCFIYQGFLRMTRVVEIDASNKQLTSDDQLLNQALNEARLAVRFIYNQKMLPFNEPINFVLIDNVPKASEEDLIGQFKKSGVISSKWDLDKNFFVIARPDDFSCLHNQDQTRCNASQVIAIKAHRGLSRNFYLLPYIKMIRGFKLTGVFFKILAILAISASLFFGVKGLLQSEFLTNKINVLNQAEQELLNQKKSFIDVLKNHDSPADIKATVNFSENLDKLIHRYPYGYDVSYIGALLSKNNLIQVQGLNWFPASSTIDDSRLKILMQATVGPFDGQFLTITQAVSDFERELKAIPGVTNVNILRRPFEEDQARAYRVPDIQIDSRVQINVEWEQRRDLSFDATKAQKDRK